MAPTIHWVVDNGIPMYEPTTTTIALASSATNPRAGGDFY